MNSYLEQSGKLLKKSSVIFDYNITFSDFCSRLKIRLYTAFCEWKMYIIGEISCNVLLVSQPLSCLAVSIRTL